MKKIIAENFQNFIYFFRYLKGKIFISLGLNITVGVLDAFGLAMFLPLLQMVDGKVEQDENLSGNLVFLVNIFKNMGIELSLTIVLFTILLFFISKGLVVYTQGVFSVNLQQYFIKSIRVKNISNLANLNYKYFVTSDIGTIQNTLSGEVDRVSRAYQTYFTSLQMALMVLVYMAFAFFVDWKFAILVSIGGVATNFIYREIYENTKGRSKNLTLVTNVFQGLIIQAVANFKYLKATGRLKLYGQKLIDQVEHIEHNNLKIGISGAILNSTREPLIVSVVCLVIFLQTQFLGSSLSVILISLLFFYRALNSLMLMQSSWNAFLTVSGSLQNMTEFSKELQKNQERNGTLNIPKFFDQLVLDKVSFNYGDNKILNDISLKIDSYETLALVGESGSGKTTLINIISGLLAPSSGQLFVDGKSRYEIDLNTYQKRIGYITQDPVIFNDSIYNNVTLWSDKTPGNIKKFREACQRAAISNFIDSLGAQEETELGNNGINLSGGQKQRISIARELFKDIDILFLDEATSALDSETENQIQENIQDLKGKLTIIIIAHRFSTIKNADRIVFMKNGTIKQTDSFSKLFEDQPEFRTMVELQELSLSNTENYNNESAIYK